MGWFITAELINVIQPEMVRCHPVLFTITCRSDLRSYLELAVIEGTEKEDSLDKTRLKEFHFSVKGK